VNWSHLLPNEPLVVIMADEQISSLRATAHPLRLRMLSLLTSSAMSAAEIARELDITHANASYHLRFLAGTGLIVEAGEEKIRGGVAKRFRHPWDAELTDPKATAEDRGLYVRAMAEELVRRATLRRPKTPARLTDAELWVTPETWEQVQSLVEEASRLIHAEAKPPRTPDTLHVNMTAATFEMDDSPTTHTGDA
jgi:DNA-binding transcriptional ArsR family regulator